MNKLTATILVEPVAKGRPRYRVIKTKNATSVMAYTPAATRKSEAQIIADIRHQLGQVQTFAAGVPLALTATFYRPRPKSLPKRVRYPVSRPDTSNFLKLLEDALNHFAYADDSQIVDHHLFKRFAAPGETPRIELKIEAVV